MTGSSFEAELEAARRRHRAGEAGPAAAIYRRLQAQDPSHPEPWHLLAVVAHQQGAQEQALALADAAIARDPGRAQYHNTRGGALRLLNRLAEARDAYRHAHDLDPGTALYATNLSVVLLEGGAAGEALALAERALDAGGAADPAALNSHALALQALDRLPEALASLERLAAVAPDFADGQSNRRVVLLQLGRTAAAREAAQDWLARAPADRDALTHLAAALAQGGAAEALDDLVRLDGHLQAVVPDLPGGAVPDAAFNAALAAHCLGHPTLQADRHGKATAAGRQTDDLTVGAPPQLHALLAGLDRAARQAAAAHAGAAPAHPWAGHPPRDWRMRVWATVLHQGGHQRPHTHPAGWMSGVYYVQVPGIDAVAVPPGTGGERAGWIEFGRPDPALRVQRGFRLRDVQPVAGQALLFPSYFWHRTHSFAGKGYRISIAFDFIPTA
ncbi:MAG: putative 2OG-Fe(II) oxygenase [Sneathiellaceae bacterium]